MGLEASSETKPSSRLRVRPLLAIVRETHAAPPGREQSVGSERARGSARERRGPQRARVSFPERAPDRGRRIALRALGRLAALALLASSTRAHARPHLLTQWRSFVGVGKPSPLKTCPKWPLHAAQTISIRLVPSSSTLWTIAPS